MKSRVFGWSLALFFAAFLSGGSKSVGAALSPEVGRVLAPNLDVRATLAMQVSIRGGAWSSEPVATGLSGDAVRLRLASTVPQSASIRWYLVVPDLSRPYNNANPPGSEGAYRWRGMDAIDYYRVHLPALDNQMEVAPFSHAGPLHAGVRAWLKARGASHAARFYHDTIGTFRFEAEIEHRGERWRTPGAADRDHRGISSRVMRVSLGSDNSYLGHLRAYFNVPGVFGSTSAQANGYLGVDCADALMAAFGHHRGKPPIRNYSVAMLVSKARNPRTVDFEQGQVIEPSLRWGKDVRPGDFVAVRYPGARTYQHIGALEADQDGDGLLSAADTVLHAGPWPLTSSRLDSGMFHGRLTLFAPSSNW
jgi:hypothetical protein